MSRRDIAVLGPGGVGGFLAAMLAHAGDPVLVIAGDDTARAIAAGGLRLESGRFGTFTERVETAGRLARPVDACFVTVKATHLEDAIGRVPADALDGGLVIPFLNGLEHVERLRSVYPPEQVVAATIRIETTRVSAGLIRHTSPFSAVELAAQAGNLPQVEAIAARLAATGIGVRVRDDEKAMLWDKFAVLAPMALLTTHQRAGIGEVRRMRRDDLTAVVTELAAVAAAEGVQIDPARVLGFVDSVPEAMETSMQRDQAAGRPLELDALGGAVLRRAARAGVETPVTARLVKELGGT